MTTFLKGQQLGQGREQKPVEQNQHTRAFEKKDGKGQEFGI